VIQIMTKPETESEKVPALVARVQPAAQIPLERLKPVPPQVKDGATTKAQMDRVNGDRTIENKVMTERGARFEPVENFLVDAFDLSRVDDPTIEDARLVAAFLLGHCDLPTMISSCAPGDATTITCPYPRPR
jgi:hypothetical protein